MIVMTGIQHTPAVGTMGSATNGHVELDFVATELDSRDSFDHEVLKIVCSWHIHNVDLSSLDIVVDEAFLNGDMLHSGMVCVGRLCNYLERRLVVTWGNFGYPREAGNTSVLF